MRNISSDRRPGVARVGSLFVVFTALLAAVLLSQSQRPLVAGEPAYRGEPLKEAPPAEVSESLRKLVAGRGLRVLGPKGKPFRYSRAILRLMGPRS